MGFFWPNLSGACSKIVQHLCTGPGMHHMICFRMALGMILVSLFFFPKSLICHQCLLSLPYIFDFIETSKNLHLIFFFFRIPYHQHFKEFVIVCMLCHHGWTFYRAWLGYFTTNGWVFFDPICLELVPKLHNICAPCRVCSIWSVLEWLLV